MQECTILFEKSGEEKPGLILGYDKDGADVGLEILDASKRAVVGKAARRAHGLHATHRSEAVTAAGGLGRSSRVSYALA